MKRLAISLSVCLALVGWAATGHAKRGGGSKTAAPAADDSAGGEGGESGGARRGRRSGALRARAWTRRATSGSAKVEEDITGPKAQRPTTTLSWQDIVVVPRKAFLKGGRLEFAPFAGLTVNDNLIRHYMFGARPQLLPHRCVVGRRAGAVLRQAADRRRPSWSACSSTDCPR